MAARDTQIAGPIGKHALFLRKKYVAQDKKPHKMINICACDIERNRPHAKTSFISPRPSAILPCFLSIKNFIAPKISVRHMDVLIFAMPFS